METVYKYKEYDNGYVLEDSASLAKQVVEEKQTDKKHRKIKNMLGDWLYEDIKAYLEEIEDYRCEVVIKFKPITE